MPIHPVQIVTALTRYLEKAGLPRIRVHDLRHSAATLMLSHGIPVTLVSEVLGHATVSMTLDVYSHVIPVHRQQVADTMERLLGSA